MRYRATKILYRITLSQLRLGIWGFSVPYTVAIFVYYCGNLEGGELIPLVVFDV